MALSGVISEIKNGKLYIRVQDDDGACEHCAVRMFCKKSGEDSKSLILDERPGLKCGDWVTVEQEGNILTKTTLLAYGLPLLFFIVGFFLGGLIPEGRVPQELIRFLCACAGLLAGGGLGRIGAKRLSLKLERHIRIKLNKVQ